MNKPKIGDKYIIEIDSHMTNKNGDLYGVKNFRSLVFDQSGLGRLTPYDEESAYAEGYTNAESKYREARDQVEREAYQRGLDDAWSAARKIVVSKTDVGYSIKELSLVFGNYFIEQIFLNHTAAEAVEKIRAYEERKAQEDEIKVGDEVEFKTNDICIRYVVTKIDDSGWMCGIETYNQLDSSRKGAVICFEANKVKKTGRCEDLSWLFGGEGK